MNHFIQYYIRGDQLPEGSRNQDAPSGVSHFNSSIVYMVVDGQRVEGNNIDYFHARISKGDEVNVSVHPEAPALNYAMVINRFLLLTWNGGIVTSSIVNDVNFPFQKPSFVNTGAPDPYLQYTGNLTPPYTTTPVSGVAGMCVTAAGTSLVSSGVEPYVNVVGKTGVVETGSLNYRIEFAKYRVDTAAGAVIEGPGYFSFDPWITVM